MTQTSKIIMVFGLLLFILGCADQPKTPKGEVYTTIESSDHPIFSLIREDAPAARDQFLRQKVRITGYFHGTARDVVSYTGDTTTHRQRYYYIIIDNYVVHIKLPERQNWSELLGYKKTIEGVIYRIDTRYTSEEYPMFPTAPDTVYFFMAGSIIED